MILIVSLGNPGEKYQNNRHNVGFMFADYLLDVRRSTLDLRNEMKPFTYDKYSHTEIARLGSIESPKSKVEDLIIAKPQTYINKSGDSVKKLLVNYSQAEGRRSKIDLIVVHDDLDIPLGVFHIQVGRGPLLHNGIVSIEKALGTKDFKRVRIGVDNRKPEARIDGETYVLQDFLPEEKKQLQAVFPKIFTHLSHLT